MTLHQSSLSASSLPIGTCTGRTTACNTRTGERTVVMATKKSPLEIPTTALKSPPPAPPAAVEEAAALVVVPVTRKRTICHQAAAATTPQQAFQTNKRKRVRFALTASIYTQQCSSTYPQDDLDVHNADIDDTKDNDDTDVVQQQQQQQQQDRLWYQPHDYYAFDRARRATVSAVLRVRGNLGQLDPTEHCVRGLEQSLSKRHYLERKVQAVRCKQMVLQQQQYQRYIHGGVVSDPESLQAVSRMFSEQSSKYALLRAASRK